MAKKFIDATGLADLLARIKAAFIRKSETTEVQSVGIDNSPTKNSTNLVESGGVFSLLGKWGVVSQTQTWTGSDATGYEYTMSNQVYGLIPQANIDLYVSAGAVFNETTGYFELNDLTDISYEEMKVIYAQTFSRYNGNSLCYAISDSRVRTNFPYFRAESQALDRIGNSPMGDVYLSGFAVNDTNLSSVYFITTDRYTNLGYSALKSIAFAFKGCRGLKKIIGQIAMQNITSASSKTECFAGCFSLESVSLFRLKESIDIPDSPLLSISSVEYAVRCSTNTTAITITLHATAYARCQADTTEYTYNGQTYTGIIALATAKNITIASA